MIKLPSKITKESWFYEDNKELLEPHLGKYYISYSSVESWSNYREDYIKQKFVGIETPDSVYASLGNYVGEAIETGEWPENCCDFEGQENVDLKALRPEGAEYEKMVLIDFGEYVFIGFIDIFVELDDGTVHCQDIKTGGKKKEDKYAGKEYTQVILYSKSLEDMGYNINKTDVYFIRREGSHVRPPLKLSKEQFVIPLEYNEERVDYAIKKVKKVVKEISDCYTTYLKIFGNEQNKKC